jgi:hypothetical protein
MKLISKTNGRIFVAAFLCLIVVLSISTNNFQVKAATQKTVYIVVNVTSQPTNEGIYSSGSSDANPAMDVNVFSPSSGSPVTQAMESTFRSSIKDSFGGSVKLTWLCQMDYLMSQSTFSVANGTAGVQGYTAMYDLMNKYWGPQIQSFGDQLAYYHLFEAKNGNYWNAYPNGPDSDYPNYQNIALSHMIIDDNYFPNVFWSHFFPADVPLAESNWVEQYIPFEYSPTYGSTTPYHLYSGMNHLQIQTLQDYEYYNLLEAINNAAHYGSSVYSIFLTANSDIVGNITAIQHDCYADTTSPLSYPSVTFKYVTAAQAMQLTQGYTDTTPPTITATRNASTYIINSSETLWNNAPYVALQYSNGAYTNMATTPVGNNVWTLTVPNIGSLAKMGVAACDLYGNPGLLTFSPLTPPTSSLPTAPPLAPSAPPEVQVQVHGVTATSAYNSTYNAGQAIDGIETPPSFWASGLTVEFPQSITLDLWAPTPVNQISTRFYYYNPATYNYNVDLSNDSVNWTPVVLPKIGANLVTDTFSQTLTRYIRVSVSDTSVVQGVAEILELKVFQQTLQPTPTPTPSPTPSLSPSSTPSPTPSPAASPTATPTPTPSSNPTTTPSPAPTSTATPSPSSTSTATPAPTTTTTPTTSPSQSPTPTPIRTVTPTPLSSTPSPTPKVSPSPTSNSATHSESLAIATVYATAAVIITIVLAATLLLLRKRQNNRAIPDAKALKMLRLLFFLN